MSSLIFTRFMLLLLLFCLNVLCPFAQSYQVEDNPQLHRKSVLKISSRKFTKGLLPTYEVTEAGTEGEVVGGGRKMRNLLSDNSEARNEETGEEGGGAPRRGKKSVSKAADEKYVGCMKNTRKVTLDVRHRLRFRSKKKGKGGANGDGAGGFGAFNADYHFPRQHPPRNN